MDTRTRPITTKKTRIEELPRDQEELAPEEAEATLGGIWDQRTLQSRQTTLIQDL